ncbi:MAG TPA: serine O-acetyltransferase EpsC [Desulfatiglandales bacterium]|nr:serine O-acetyltransferase EpsC [Desulfatiglandales bacterium]
MVEQREHEKDIIAECKAGFETRTEFREQLPEVVENIVRSCHEQDCFEHIDAELIPSRESVIGIVFRLREILFPGYFSREKIDAANLRYQIGQSVDSLFESLSEQITRSLRHECLRYNQPCIECAKLGYKEALIFLASVPALRRVLATDVRAAYEGDPAAKSYDEIVFSYPGVFAVTVYRIAHQLVEQGIPLLPRIMTEYAHSVTGIDIHPGARIGESFFIDHGTGVVIGETTVIGRNVRVYQSVTLGALSLPKNAGERLRGKKRHPTIEDDVIIYAGATILGEKAVIGARSVIGGNVWITEPVPPDTKIFLKPSRLGHGRNRGGFGA